MLIKIVINVCAVAMIAPFVVAHPLTAADTTCTGTLTGEHENVIVPQGAACIIADADVTGNIKVESFGGLTITGATRIDGSIQSDGSRYVRVRGSAVTIGGDLQIKKALEWSGYEPGTRIRGNVQYEENSGFLLAAGGVIRGNVQIFKNTGGGSVSGNTVRQNLQCKENFPAPVGSGNIAGGNKEDQCAGL
jgi:hypothetical protein